MYQRNTIYIYIKRVKMDHTNEVDTQFNSIQFISIQFISIQFNTDICNPIFDTHARKHARVRTHTHTHTLKEKNKSSLASSYNNKHTTHRDNVPSLWGK
jgi:hypothetical protein